MQFHKDRVERFIAITRCVKSKKLSLPTMNRQIFFHFKGFYKGQKISQIAVLPKDGAHFVLGEDYLLFLQQDYIESEIIYCRLIKFKNLD